MDKTRLALAGILLTTLCWSATGADLAAYRKSLAAGDAQRLTAMVRADAGQTPTGPRGESLLHLASWEPIGDDRARMIAALLSAGARVDARDHKGATPLAWASARECAECVRLLLQAGAQATARDARGVTPLHVSGPQVAALLIAAGADPHAADADGNRPLHKMWHEALLAPGVNVRNLHGFTPLHFAALRGDDQGVQWLLARGADPGAESTAPYEFQELAPEWKAKPEVIEPGTRAYDIALRWHDRNKWSVGTHRKTVEILEQATPRRKWYSR